MISSHVADSDHAAGIDENALRDQKEKVRRFRKRLQAREAFILPEVWDVISARVIGDAGFDIVGISPVSVAWSCGLLPSDRVPLDTLVETAKSVAMNFSVPVNADLEGVIGRSMEEIGRAVGAVISAGCVGVTIGDGGRGGQHGMASMHDMTAAIKAAKAAALETRVPAVVTARTEAFLLEPPPYSPFETAVERAEAYFAAGADCIAVPGVQHIQIIERLSAHVDGPLQITVGLTPAPDLKALNAAGASSVALGTALMRSLLGNLRLKAEEIFAFGQFNNLEKAIPADALNDLLR
ncbi:3-methyl-2-oxobutanoate hydroxymethyltransferase [Rhodomicrobium udaipurense JA643]|jgi:2-methylisocitrate lyase-like PEP mutase family enzyme|uniref:Isocitrate lyase/phosphoenolpyruvate mutase family protein n=1 Tax=Rhodomicrobium udaipurense TaxID=1202716 RepID=A0A8I1KIC0_9HYPH|nr:isocitrate lyase/phosphoenolpyruvate mutase family protein [Rhodomicrobium udaipurense]KAI96436.1 3-methyl-2-oxobutanoate hydroxymethyltransferase [Rhodomicrobium udaipurense JA643]MBJ7544570.1 isocitrate lyase/phosphoenolpyruvate mutase family protein [Rhodomicrobium udaipurense]